MVLNVNERPEKNSHLLLFAVQHFLAMIVACITVPIIVNLDLGAEGIINPLPIDATIVSAGIGTLFYLVVTRFKSPVFLSSSFAYISAIGSALSINAATYMIDGQEFAHPNLWALVIGMAMVGILYSIVALIIKFTGTGWVRKLLAPVVIGPVIMTIGLILAGSAVNNITTVASGNAYNLIAVGVGLATMVFTALASHYGKNYGKLIPFIIGLGGGYILAAILTGIGHLAKVEMMQLIDFSPFVNIFSEIKFSSFFKVPDFLFLRKNGWSSFEASQLPGIMLIFLPVAFVTMSEHIGDHENLGSIIEKDLIEDPGLSRTLVGDGVASAIGGVLSGTANTTYGENVAVIGITRIASVWVIGAAAIFSILVGFFVPFTAFIETIPSTVVGGVSLLLYGFIANSGLKILVREKVDLNDNRNVFIIAAILISGIGGLALEFYKNIKIEPIATAMIIGILLNVMLRPKAQPEVIVDVKEDEED